MSHREFHYFSFAEVCDASELSSSVVIEVVEHGIVEPQGADPDSWAFDAQMIALVKKAYRLHSDLGIDWAGIALAMHLLEELESLRTENQTLKSRLGRFVPD